MSSESDPSPPNPAEAGQLGRLTKKQAMEKVAGIKRELAAQKQREEEISRFTSERRKMIAEKGIDSALQRFVDMDPGP